MLDRRVEAFLATVETGSFTQAARRLFVTQPTVTNQIRSLEEELGAHLFERSAQGTRLTAAGEIAERHLRLISEIEQRMRRELQQSTTSCRSFTLCCPDNMVTYDYETFRDVVRRTSDVMEAQVRVVATPAANQVGDYLASGRADAMLGMIEPVAGIGGPLRARALLTGAAHILCAISDPLAARAELGPADLDGLSVLLPDDDLQNTQALVEAASSLPGCAVTFTHVSSTSAMIPLVEMGSGVGFSTFPITDRPAIRSVPLRMAGQRHLGLIWHARRANARMDRLIDAVEAVFRAHYPVGSASPFALACESRARHDLT